MSELDEQTPSWDEQGGAFDAPQDPANLQAAEDFDADEMEGDPVEQGVDPPDDWTVVTAERPTERESREGEPLDVALTEENPDSGEGQPAVDEPREPEIDTSGADLLDVDEEIAAEPDPDQYPERGTESE